MIFNTLLPLAASLLLSACGGSSPGDTRSSTETTVIRSPLVAATIASVSPNINIIQGVQEHSLMLVGENLLGVKFSLNDVPCRNTILIGPPGGMAGNWTATIKCDIPAAPEGFVTLKASESTNLSDISKIAPVHLWLAPAGTVPSLHTVSPSTVARGEEFDLVFSGVGVGSLIGKVNGMGITVGGTDGLSCWPVITNLNTDNTSGTTRCLAVKEAGPGTLRWHYDADRHHIEAGMLTILP